MARGRPTSSRTLRRRQERKRKLALRAFARLEKGLPITAAQRTLIAEASEQMLAAAAARKENHAGA